MSWVMVNLNIKQLKLRKCDLEYSLISLSDSKQALQYQQTCELQDLQMKYDAENELIEQEFADMEEDDYDKMAEKLTKQYELTTKLTTDQEAIRSRMAEKETVVNRRQEVMETQLEAVNADLENMQNARNKFIEQECKYFKNEQ